MCISHRIVVEFKNNRVKFYKNKDKKNCKSAQIEKRKRYYKLNNIKDSYINISIEI